MTRLLIRATLALCGFIIPAAAYAHTGAGAPSGFAHGFAHPISGIDHTLAMVLVGLLAFQLGGRAVWLLPMAFTGLMIVGGILGIAGVNLPMVETGIAVSVIILGASVAFRIKTPTAAATGVVGLFALFHGHAHGAEMPGSVSGLTYAIGFLAATASLHLMGIGTGLLFSQLDQRRGAIITQIAGSVAALAGVGLVLGIL